MLGSMHAVRLTHLQHHRDCLGGNDVEGGGSALRGGRSAVGSHLPRPASPRRLAVGKPAPAALNSRRASLNGGWIALVLIAAHPVISYHFAAIALGQTLTGFFAVWTVHHDCDRWQQIARTLRHRLKSGVTFNMFYHLEHHLYPRVPTCHLPALAERLDTAIPELDRKQVF
jgi:fatty acid desaturase